MLNHRNSEGKVDANGHCFSNCLAHRGKIQSKYSRLYHIFSQNTPLEVINQNFVNKTHCFFNFHHF